jgi:hypothetical protein
LELGERQKLVVVSSTWGSDGLFGGVPELLTRLMDQLPPPRFRVALLLHPAIAGAHGRRQVDAWTRSCRAAGMLLADPADDWRAYIAAADHLIGDRGSVTAYGAAIGLPILCVSTGTTGATAAGSPQSLVLDSANHLDLRRPAGPQLAAARAIDQRLMAAAMTSRPGRSGRLFRRAIYRLIGLKECGSQPAPAPIPVAIPHSVELAS